MTEYDDALVEKAAQAVYNALADDDTHIMPGVDPETIAARAVLDAVADDLRAKAWDVGYKTGYSYRGPYGEAAGNPVPENPYRKEADRG